MSLLVGTSGYSYTDWIGSVYPTGMAQKDFLAHYAQQFPFVELNFSYYKRPEPRTLEAMLKSTTDSFLFAIKGYKALTHERNSDLHAEVSRFKEGITPLVESKRLATIVMQFPYSFHYTPASRTYLDTLCGEFEGLPLAIEFRTNEWQRDSVYQGLTKREVAWINVDEPQLPGLLRPTAIATANHAYVRFHGRNTANWWTGDNTSRYDYNYGNDELAQWIPSLQSLLLSTKVVMILFNNHARGMAVNNARTLQSMLSTAEHGGAPASE